MIIGMDMLVLVADLALVILAVEAVVLVAMLLRSASAPSRTKDPRRTFLLTTFSGFGLLFALRAALAQSHPALILAGLSFGGMAHAIDLFIRMRGTETNHDGA